MALATKTPRTKGRRASDHVSDTGWRLEKKISLPTLVTLAIIGAGIYGFWYQQGVNTKDIADAKSMLNDLSKLPDQLRSMRKTINEIRCDLKPDKCQLYWFDGHAELRNEPPS